MGLIWHPNACLSCAGVSGGDATSDTSAAPDYARLPYRNAINPLQVSGRGG